MALAQAMLGHIPWYMFIPISLAEVAGGFSGAVIMWICYADHFKASAGKIDPIRIRNIFSTTPGIRNLPRNFFCEFFATFIFIAGILTICHACQGVQSMLAPLGIGLLVWAIGMGMGGTTGFAMNLARDMGPRLAHAFLPIAHKADNDWQYGILVPGLAPFFGAAAAAIFVRAFFQF
jgi:glycerol uptake facilitator protein